MDDRPWSIVCRLSSATHMNTTTLPLPARWRIIWAIFRQDLASNLRSHHFQVTMAIPIGLSILFSFIFPPTITSPSLHLAVYGATDSGLIERLAAQSEMRIEVVESEAALVSAVENEAVAGLSIPAEFDALLAQGEQPTLSVMINDQPGRHTDTARFQRLLSEQIWAMQEETPPVAVQWQELALPVTTLDIEQYILLMLLFLGLFMTSVSVVAVSMVEDQERQRSTVLLASPAHPADLIISKAALGLVSSLLLALILILLNRGWVGTWPLTAVTLLLTICFCVSLGLLLGSVLKTQSQCNSWGGVVVLILVLPLWVLPTALEQLPLFLQWAVYSLPTY
jgi:ABC-type Na+ efflux pump permease subunit